MGKLLEKYKLQVIDIATQLEDLGVFRGRHKLPKNQEVFLNKLLTGTLADSWWPASLFKLTQVLHTLHKKGVVVLVDEYDTPISHATQCDYLPEVCPFYIE